MAVLRVALCAFSLSCDPQPVDERCVESIEPVVVSIAPALAAKYAAGVITPIFTQGTIDTGLRWLNVMLSDTTAICPTTWLGEYYVLPSDFSVLWLGVVVPEFGDPRGTYAVETALVSTPPVAFNAGSPFITKCDYRQGETPVLASNLSEFELASGTITITELDVSSRIVGSVNGTFSDGSSVSFSFSVPVCTDSCGSE